MFCERVIGESDENKRYRVGRSNNGRGPLLGSPADDIQGCVSLVADGILKCVKGERNGKDKQRSQEQMEGENVQGLSGQSSERRGQRIDRLDRKEPGEIRYIGYLQGRRGNTYE